MSKKLLKWQQLIIDQIRSETNNQLYEHLLDVAQPDDYDGSYTDRASYEYSAVQEEIEKRLTEIGFLEPIKENIVLSPADYAILIEAIQNPVQPNEKLKEAFKWYQEYTEKVKM